MQLRELLPSEPVPVVAPDVTVVEAARMMTEQDAGMLPVVESDRLVGVVTDRDIVVRCVAQAKQAELLSVREIMSIEVIHGFVDQTVDEARELMSKNDIGRLPVTDRQHKVLGVVTRAALDGEPVRRKKPVKVTLYKDKTDSHGGHHKVPLRTVYVTGKQSQEEAKTAATKVVEEEQRRPLDQIADGLDAEDGPGPGAAEK